MNEKRDMRAEVEQLKAAHPEVERIPDPVAKAAAQGMPLLEAYRTWKAGEKSFPTSGVQAQRELAALQAENQRLKRELMAARQELAVWKQNAGASARAVGGGVQGGGVEAQPRSHAFLTGLESGGW